MARVTDASVDLGSAATISDHDTTGLLECSAVCCSNEMEAYQSKQKAKFLKMEGILHVRGTKNIHGLRCA